MKKLLLSIVLLSSLSLSPLGEGWREHEGFFGRILNTAEAVVEAPIEIVDGDYSYNRRKYRDDRRKDNIDSKEKNQSNLSKRQQRLSKKRNSASQSTKNKSKTAQESNRQ